jgi:hypothetical protein
MAKRLNLRNLSQTDKDRILAGGLSLSVAASTYGIYNMIENKEFDASDGEAQTISDAMLDDTVDCEDFYVNVDFEVEDFTTQQTLIEAFATAREKLGKNAFFEYNGKSYTTSTKAEIGAMTPEKIADLTPVLSLEPQPGNVDEVKIEQPLLADTPPESNSIQVTPTIGNTELETDTNKNSGNNDSINEVTPPLVKDSEIDLKDFDDPLFSGVNLPQSSNNVNAVYANNIQSYDDFNDVLFDNQTSIPISSAEDLNRILYADIQIDDFHDPLFVDNVEVLSPSGGVNPDQPFYASSNVDFDDPLFGNNNSSLPQSSISGDLSTPVANTEKSNIDFDHSFEDEHVDFTNVDYNDIDFDDDTLGVL